MKKRYLLRLEQGPHKGIFSRFFLTRLQRLKLRKWLLYSLCYLILQVVQDVIFSRIRVLGGCPDMIPAYLFLVCMLERPADGGLFALCASVFRCLSGAVLGPISVALIPVGGMLLSAFRQAYIRRKPWWELLCCFLGLWFHTALLFGLGVFLGSTTPDRWISAFGGVLGAGIFSLLLYPLVRAIAVIGGPQWNE